MGAQKPLTTRPRVKIVITGSSSGIGLKLVAHLTGAGHQVWGFSRRAQPLSAPDPPSLVRHSRGDVSSWESVSAFRRELGSDWAALDALICCAAIQGPIGPAVAIDPRDWCATLETNLNGTFYAIRAFHDLLIRSAARPKIICFSGGGSTSPRPNFSAYAASKTAVVRLVENLAAEWQGEPIDINAVAPGAVDTQMTDQVIALGAALAGEKEYRSALEQKAQPQSHKYPELVSFLLSPSSDGITGRLLSAVWDPWRQLASHREDLLSTDIYTLRRITPEGRGRKFD